MKLLAILWFAVAAFLVVKLLVAPLVRWWQLRTLEAALRADAREQASRFVKAQFTLEDSPEASSGPPMHPPGRTDEKLGGVQSVVPGKKVLG